MKEEENKSNQIKNKSILERRQTYLQRFKIQINSNQKKIDEETLF